MSIFKSLIASLACILLLSSSVIAERVEIEARPLIHLIVRRDSDLKYLYINNIDVPYLTVGGKKLDASYPTYSSKVKIIADTDKKTISMTGTLDNVGAQDIVSKDYVVKDIKATISMTWSNVDFTNNNLLTGADTLGAPNTGMIAAGEASKAKGLGVINLSHSDASVFGTTSTISIPISSKAARFVQSNLLPPGASNRDMVLIWSKAVFDANATYFEPLPELKAWYMNSFDQQTINILGSEYRVFGGDFHLGAGFQVIVPKMDCKLALAGDSAVAVLGYDNQNPHIVDLPASDSADLTNAMYSGTQGFDLGQPTHFLPGLNSAVAQIQYLQSEGLHWTINYNQSGLNTADVNADVPECATIVPELKCKNVNNGKVEKAVFGYSNANSFSINVPAGDNNKLSGLNNQQIQPEVFLSGNHDNAFEVQGTDLNVTWQLASITVSTADSAPACDVVTKTDPNCNDVNIREDQFGIDSSALAISTYVRRVGNRLIRLGQIQKGKEFQQLASDLYNRIWTDIWSFSSILQVCEEHVDCIQTNNTDKLTILKQNYTDLYQTVSDTVASWRSVTGSNKKGRIIMNKANTFLKESEAHFGVIPTVSASCN